MKTITKEIKVKIITQYYGQKVMYVGGIGLVEIGYGGWNLRHPDFYLQLKSLKDISDDDAIEVAKIFGYKETDTLPLFVLKQKGRSISERFIDKQYASINGFTYIIQIYQYLQSKGYALPYGDYSVEDLVELGIIKLK